MMTFEDWKKIQSSLENAEMNCDSFLSNLFSGGRAVEIDSAFARWLATESPYVIDCRAEVDEENLCLYANYILSFKERTFMVSATCGFGREEFYDQEVREVYKATRAQLVTTWESLYE